MTTLSKEVHRRVKDTAKRLGISETSFMRQALLYYLDSLAPYIALQRELEAWEHLSDEALFHFEKSL